MDNKPDKQSLKPEKPETADDREIARQHDDELLPIDKKAAKGRKKKEGLTPDQPMGGS